MARTRMVLALLMAAAAIRGTGCKPPAPASSASPGPTPLSTPSTETTMSLTVQSSAFSPNGPIPRRHTGDGEDFSPPITWSGAPPATKEYALICDDPDAPSPQPWVHWVIYRIPPAALALPEHVTPGDAPPDPRGAVQGRNSWGSLGYRGPAPPRGHGVHHYHFQVYALDAPLTLNAGATKEQLLSAMRGHIVAQGELIGAYQR